MKLLQHEEGVAHTLTLAYTLRPTPYTITLHPAPSPVTITRHPAPNGEGQITNMYPREGARSQRETKNLYGHRERGRPCCFPVAVKSVSTLAVAKSHDPLSFISRCSCPDSSRNRGNWKLGMEIGKEEVRIGKEVNQRGKEECQIGNSESQP